MKFKSITSIQCELQLNPEEEIDVKKFESPVKYLKTVQVQIQNFFKYVTLINKRIFLKLKLN